MKFKKFYVDSFKTLKHYQCILNLSSVWLHERGFKRQRLCQWRGSENGSEVAQRTEFYEAEIFLFKR